MATFATVPDLEADLGRSFDATEYASAEQALKVATSLIQGYLGYPVFHVEDDVVVLFPKGHLVLLPGPPVTDVSSVTSDGEPVEFVLRPAGVLRLTGRWSELVTVTYSHGHDPIPDAIKGACLSNAKRAVINPLALRQETTGPFSVTYPETSAGVTGSGLSDDEKRMVWSYKLTNLV
jgi:hypothetical protein